MAHGRGHSDDAHNHHHAGERRFDRHITIIDNKSIGCRRVTCIGCGQPGEILDRHTNGMVPKVIIQNFERKGWAIGANEKHDYCPKCEATRKAERRAKRFKPVAPVALVSQEDTPMNGHHSPNASLNAIGPALSEMLTPAPATRADKRLIFDKLNEVYIDETAGYKPPWTDAVVAKDLGVPMAWVSAVREENFGPANDNSEIRQMLTRVTDAALEANRVLGDAKAIRIEATSLVERVNKVCKDATEIGKTLNGLLTIAERIERSLKP